jgi:cellulose biosynthesis protein BcsQ
MSGRVVAVYSAKGGVGKTTLAVNLAWASAVLSKRRTLLWDLDPQGGASFLLRQQAIGSGLRSRIVDKEDVSSFVRPSEVTGLDILSADPSLRHLDRDFHELGKRRRLAKVTAAIAADYDRVVIDCPPGLTDTSDQILHAADLVVVPVIPAALSQRALDAIKEHLHRRKGADLVLAPVFSMVDRRRQLHRRDLEKNPKWPVIPMSSAFERMSEEQAPIGEIMPASSAPVKAIADLWRRIEKTLASA